MFQIWRIFIKAIEMLQRRQGWFKKWLVSLRNESSVSRNVTFDLSIYFFLGKATPPHLQPRGLRHLAEEVGQEVGQRHDIPVHQLRRVGDGVRQVAEQLLQGLQEPHADLFRFGNDPEAVRHRFRTPGQAQVGPEAGIPKVRSSFVVVCSCRRRFSNIW